MDKIRYALPLLNHPKCASWVERRREWLRVQAPMPETIAEFLDSFVEEFGDRNEAFSAQSWIETCRQGTCSVT